MKTNKFYIIITTLFSLTFLLINPALSKTLTVPDSYPTIQGAVNAAANGDIIQVAGGTYTENVLVNTPVTIRGKDGAADTIVVAAVKNTAVFAVVASDVTISGFTVKGADGHLNATGVLIGGRFPGDTLYVGQVGDVTISKCIVEFNGQGIYVWGANNTTIVNNTVRYNSSVPADGNAGTGIIAWAETGPTALARSSSGPRAGIPFDVSGLV